MKYNYKITQEIYLAHYLRRCAKNSLEAGKTATYNINLHFMSCLMFCAFALEAFLNHVGTEIIVGYEYMETNLEPMQKLKFLYAQAGLVCDESQRPAQTVRMLFSFRNFMAHGKTIKGTAPGEADVDPNNLTEFFRSINIDSNNIENKDEKRMFQKWESYYKFCNEEDATRCLKDIETIMNELSEAAGLTEEIREQGAENPIWERNRKTNIKGSFD